MTATLTATTTVQVTWTRAAKIHMVAKIDMPEYGLKAEQIFYLVRSSANDGTYYIVTWNYAESKWSCPCKHSVERPTAKPCRHRRLVSADCKARREAKQTMLRTQEGLVQAPNGMWVTPEQLVNVPGAPRSTYEAARYGDGVQATVNRLSRAGLMA
jgi:hypothetical protein